MEKQPPGAVDPDAARAQLRAARQAHDTSVRRAMLPAGFILALSVFCGALTVAPAYRGPGRVMSLVAVVWFLAELAMMSARNQWRPLRSLPKPHWGILDVTLICVAALVGGVIGPHLLASHGNSGTVSWALGIAVTLIVAACLFGAQASYRRRACRSWPR